MADCASGGVVMSPTVGSLCTGYGGLDLAVAAVLGAEPVWFAEIDPAASRLLEHRWPGVPNHGDLTATDWTQVERVDIVTTGWPCQPWSQAGTRKGAKDERAIWPAVAAAIRAVRPRYVFLENVSAIAGAGELARACGDLAEAGYVGSWRCVRASDVGAPHRRERIFIVAANTEDIGQQRNGDARGWRTGSADGGGSAADTNGARWGWVEPRSIGEVSGETPRAGQADAGRRGRVAADSSGVGRGEGRPEPARLVRGSDAAVGGDAAPHTDRELVRQQPVSVAGGGSAAEPGNTGADWAGYTHAIRRWERALGRPAPAPTVLGRRGGQQLSPRFVEWMQGLPDGWVTDVPGLTRNQQLKALGNGVVPQQAAAALRHLLPLLNDLEAAA